MLGGAGPQHRGHAALLALSHQRAAEDDQIEPILLRDRTCGDQRAELAQRVTGHAVALGAPELLPSSETCAENCRLGELRAVVDPRERILAHGLDRRLEQVWADARHLVA